MTGLYPARDIRNSMSRGFEHSPVELNARMLDQSSPSRQPVLRHAETRLGTKPSMVTPASWTNCPNFRVVGAPPNIAMVALFIRVA